MNSRLQRRNRRSKHLLGPLGATALGFVAAFGLLPQQSEASLIINEIHNSNNGNREWLEFLVVSDITLGALDSYWFGDTNSTTSAIQNSSRFDSASILSNVSYFTSTSDILRAGTILVVGGNAIQQDFVYNPNTTDPNDTDSWNLTFSKGVGFVSNPPSNLDGASDVVWLANSQPTSPTDTSGFVSAVAFLNSPSATGGGAIADYVTAQSGTNSAFQTIHTGPGGGYDGNLANNSSLSNLGGASIQFGNSEGAPTPGVANSAANAIYIQNLQAVPEPAALVPLALLAIGSVLVLRKKLPAQATA